MYFVGPPVSISGGLENAPANARAVGAQRYVWTKDGEEIDGETGESLTVAWTRGDYVQHTYAVAPVYDVFGTETVGTAQSFSVKNNPCAFTIIMR